MEEDILTKIRQENEDLEELYKKRINTELKKLGARNCRNIYKENVIVTGPSDIIKQILKKCFIYMDLMKYYAEEHVVSDTQKNRVTMKAMYAIGTHKNSGAACQTEKCINCVRLNLNPRNHPIVIVRFTGIKWRKPGEQLPTKGTR